MKHQGIIEISWNR